MGNDKGPEKFRESSWKHRENMKVTEIQRHCVEYLSLRISSWKALKLENPLEPGKCPFRVP